MRIPVDWLREFVEFTDVEETAQWLTRAGLETSREAGHEFPANVVSARIVACERHPDADRLSVCRVDAGDGAPVTVVCGAPNVAAGRVGALARPGAAFPGFVVEAKKIRGVASHGMLCSEKELGLSDDHSGILFLPDSTPLGLPLAQVLPAREWLVCEATSNRGDCMSVRGVAREIAALRAVSLLQSASGSAAAPPPGSYAVAIDDGADCPRYSLRVVEGVVPGPSPAWLRERLEAAGIRPVVNIVDVTNYVLLELGHPLHAFDLDRVSGMRIGVRRAKAGERLVTLDGKERELSAAMLVITDASGPVALAGLMGGESTAVAATTHRVLLEGASFSSAVVRAGSRGLGLASDASARFERGVDPEGVPAALDRAVELLRQLHPEARTTHAVDAYPSPRPRANVALRERTVARILGAEFPMNEVRGILQRLGLDVRDVAGGWATTAPTWRADIAHEEDLVEEVGRIHGYDKIPDRRRVHEVTAMPAAPRIDAQRRARRILLGLGLTELVTPGLTDSARERRLSGPDETLNPVTVRNPISKDHDTLRSRLAPSLVEVLATNHARSERDLAVFEVSRTYGWSAADRVEERLHVGVLLSGEGLSAAHSLDLKSCDFFDIKGLVEVYVEEFWGVSPEFGGGAPAVLASATAATVHVSGRCIGWLGELGREARKIWDLPADLPVFVAELDVEDAPRPNLAVRFRALPRHPGASRDVALVVRNTVHHADLVRSIHAAGADLLERLRLFDVYEGPPLPAGERSLAFSLTFRAPERSLTNEEVDARVAAIVERVQQDHGARLR